MGTLRRLAKLQRCFVSGLFKHTVKIVDIVVTKAVRNLIDFLVGVVQ